MLGEAGDHGIERGPCWVRQGTMLGQAGDHGIERGHASMPTNVVLTAPLGLLHTVLQQFAVAHVKPCFPSEEPKVMYHDIKSCIYAGIEVMG